MHAAQDGEPVKGELMFDNVELTGFSQSALNTTTVNQNQVLNIHEITHQQAFLMDYREYLTEEDLKNRLDIITRYLNTNLSSYFAPVVNHEIKTIAFNDDKTAVNVTLNGYMNGKPTEYEGTITLAYETPNNGVELNALLEKASYKVLKNLSADNLTDIETIQEAVAKE